jgi:uncharacterized membrane protein SirB2
MEVVTVAALVVPQGIINWVITMFFCFVFGLITFGALMINYQNVRRDESKWVNFISILFLFILNTLTLMLVR